MSFTHIWAEIDLTKIGENIKRLRKKAKSTGFMAVVKADGYGHGSVEVAETALKNGADWLGVARINEAIKIREAGIKAPLLILGYTDPCDADKIIKYNLTQTVFSVDIAKRYSRIAAKEGEKINVHIKVDTGMGRLGFVVDDNLKCADRIGEICRLDNIVTEGIYTHFASSDSIDREYTENQIKLFKKLLEKIEEKGVLIPIKHAANSAGIMEYEESHFDLVRAGIAMYGLYPSSEVRKDIVLEPAMELKCRITQVKKVSKGFCVSYGSTYKTSKETTLATLPVGYADGFNRHFSSTGEMIVKGEKVPVAGRVCMDQTVIDVGDLEVNTGDEVVLFGKQNGAEISIDDIAKSMSTINYEVVTTIMGRVPRVYISR